MPKKFTPQFRDRAIRMVFDRQAAEGGPRAASIRAVAQYLGCGPRDPAKLVAPAESSGSGALAVSGSESLEEENRQLRRELAETRRVNEILKEASAYFAAELDRPTPR